MRRRRQAILTMDRARSRTGGLLLPVLEAEEGGAQGELHLPRVDAGGRQLEAVDGHRIAEAPQVVEELEHPRRRPLAVERDGRYLVPGPAPRRFLRGVDLDAAVLRRLLDGAPRLPHHRVLGELGEVDS